MTPKSLLRHKRAVSAFADLGPSAAFCRVLKDDAETKSGESLRLVEHDNMRRVILCSGKVYYDLYEEREKRGANDVYLLRLEQLYPFPLKSLTAELARFKQSDIVWCQEEPGNMGAWTFVEPLIKRVLKHAGTKAMEATYAGRPAAASPAVGTMPQHLAQRQRFLEEAFKA